jgi:hypothetical protein
MRRTDRARFLGFLGCIALGLFPAACDQDEDLGYVPDDSHHVKPLTGFLIVQGTVVPPDTVLVIDAARLEVHSREYSDATCYYVDAEDIDVGLRE